LEAEAARADAERAALGEDEDNDNRKLRKPDRMRMVIKNKDEGTELFKGCVTVLLCYCVTVLGFLFQVIIQSSLGGNYRPAAARYHKALSHCGKNLNSLTE
jgi:hypothetical protein